MATQALDIPLSLYTAMRHYPHSESTFPRSREILTGILREAPADERPEIAGGNSAHLHHFGAAGLAVESPDRH